MTKMAEEIASDLADLAVKTTANIRSLRLRYSRLLVAVPPRQVIRTALALANSPDSIRRFVAYEIVKEHKPAFASLTAGQLLQLGDGIDTWGAVDCFASYLSGPLWRDAKLSTAEVNKWAQSPDRWWRRAALVSTLALSRSGEKEHVRKVVRVCAMVVLDRDDMVVKALSWALRELSRKHPEEALEFLTQHAGSLAPRVTREVRHKITTGLKAPRKRW